jgi:glycerophosphoryl diester phosphodiesterase
MLFDFIPPYVFAHRGASAHAPENTISAFQLAFEQGAPFIEFDVKLTSDQQVVIIHDRMVDRTTNGHGRVNQMTLAELKRLDAGAWFDEKFQDERIPTLDEVFETFGNKLFMNVEFKHFSSPFDGLLEKVSVRIKKHHLEKRIILSSFLPTDLIRAHQLLPEVPCGQLIFAGRSGGWQRTWGSLIDLQAVHPYMTDVTAKSVIQAHKRKRLVHVWTVNGPAEIQRLCNLGVDGILTDDPLLARRIIST